MPTVSKAAASAALMLLAGCGGGGGSDGDGSDDAVPMSSRADVLREVSVVSGIASELGTDISPTAASTVRRSPMHQAAASHWRPAAAGGKKQASVPAVYDDGRCDTGSVSLSDGSRTESFRYFAVTAQVDYEITDYRDCVVDYSNDGYVETDYDNGRIEFGGTRDSSTGIYYGYTQFGTGNTPEVYRYHYQESGQAAADIEIRSLGRFEFQLLQDGHFDQATLLAYDLRDNSNYSISLDLGKDANPFRFEQFNDGSLTLDGPYRYSSSECSGGTAAVSTNQPITSDPQSGYLNGGQIRLSAGAASATVTVHSDGSATYQLSNGLSGTLSSGEVYDALQAPEC